MRPSAYLWALLMSSSCSIQSPCEAQGGTCTATSMDCGPSRKFVGYDAVCEASKSKCCAPVVAAPADAGTSCPGVCFTNGHICETGTNRVDGGACPQQGTCCDRLGTSCGNKGGVCQSQDLACVKILGGVELCGLGSQCCAR